MIKVLSEEEIKILDESALVKKATSTRVFFTEEFKEYFIEEHKKGKTAREVFEEVGLPVEILGITRVQNAVKWGRKPKSEKLEKIVKKTAKESEKAKKSKKKDKAKPKKKKEEKKKKSGKKKEKKKK